VPQARQLNLMRARDRQAGREHRAFLRPGVRLRRDSVIALPPRTSDP